ncbi:TPA: hypothetical protein ACSCYS_004265 [Aeromonas veronii]
MSTKYLKITEKELLALVATADSCQSMAEGTGDGDFKKEADEAIAAIRSIEKRNGILLQSDYSDPDVGSVDMARWSE